MNVRCKSFIGGFTLREKQGKKREPKDRVDTTRLPLWRCKQLVVRRDAWNAVLFCCLLASRSPYRCVLAESVSNPRVFAKDTRYEYTVGR
jgi:hypothetical protein